MHLKLRLAKLPLSTITSYRIGYCVTGVNYIKIYLINSFNLLSLNMTINSYIRNTFCKPLKYTIIKYTVGSTSRGHLKVVNGCADLLISS